MILVPMLLVLTVGLQPASTQEAYPCFKHHGRFSSQNGITHRIWLIGTNRSVGVTEGALPKVIEDLEEQLDAARRLIAYLSPGPVEEVLAKFGMGPPPEEVANASLARLP